ncbi:MAG: tRNA-dihydrouridine synthase, partial [Candidatus Nomurabacteria bacterium]|nr:tRNA-dihydrouridine synthase [Candidatus Nomurabacteria bacterium]
GAGAALCKTPQLAQDIIRATKRGAGNIPVSVKVRLGWNHDETEKWMPALLKTKPAVITIHARTRQDMSKTDPSWTAVKRAVELRDKISPETKIIANGGIMNHEQGRDVISQTGCDGIMMGKAVFGNPWLFDENHKPPSVTEKLTVMLEHTKLFTELLGDIKNFAIMKKHYKAYANGFSGAKELRIKLMTAITPQDVENYVDNFLLSYEK